MYTLSAKIEIGNFVFDSVNDVEITKSVEELSDTAVIKVPTKFKIKDNNEEKYIEEVIKVEDSVKIILAYDGKYEGVEFVGYVSKINPKTPIVEIHCEDAMWLLRRKSVKGNWGKTTLKTILETIVSGTKIQLSTKIPNYEITKYTIKNKNGAQALQELKSNVSLSVFIDDDYSLYCGLEQATNIGERVIYDLNYNLVENNLQFISNEDKKIKIVRTWIDKKTNKRKTYTTGDKDGEENTMNIDGVVSEAVIKEMAEKAFKDAKNGAFTGDLTSFLIPFATRGMAAEIIDTEHKNREGNYFIKKVVTTFGTSGARRKVTLGNKL